MKILGLSLLFLSASSIAAEIEIVGPDSCYNTGAMLIRCAPAPVSLRLNSAEPYVNHQTAVGITQSGQCSTQYPISLSLKYQDGRDIGLNALRQVSSEIDQKESATVAVSVYAPYSNYAYFSPTCRIVANIESDVVDTDELEYTLSRLKYEAVRSMSIIDDRLKDKKAILELFSATGSYEALIEIAEQSTASFYELNDLLINSCSDLHFCSWSDQIGTIAFSSIMNLTDSQLQLLIELSSRLDQIVPSDCDANNCVAELVDSDTRAAIESVKTSIDTSQLSLDIAALVEDKVSLLEAIADYKSTANKYDIAWDAI